jgi:hypothetical protein
MPTSMRTANQSSLSGLATRDVSIVALAKHEPCGPAPGIAARWPRAHGRATARATGVGA